MTVIIPSAVTVDTDRVPPGAYDLNAHDREQAAA